MSKIWRLRKSPALPDPDFLQTLGVHPVLAQVLWTRGIADPGEADRFLTPRLSDLHDPFLFKDMVPAIERVRRAIDRKEKVMIYGDYDVDGVTSSAVLCRALRRQGADVMTYIPHRMEEGYGLNLEIIPTVKDAGVTLIITVDCGITSFEEIEALSGEGVDAVVLDHHEAEGGRVPSARAVIDPKQPGCSYPFRDLAAVGIVAKFIQALTGSFPEEDLDLIAMGTVADVAPLRDENRVFVRLGLPQITKSQKPGVRALIRSARVEGKTASSHTIGFVLGPRLNAAGRMGTANTSLDLLLSQDEGTSLSLAMMLESHNRERQKLQGSVVDEAIAFIEADTGILNDKVLVVPGEKWHKGVLGIAATKIAEKYGRPALVISFDNGLGVGSARSVEGFHLNEALAHCADVLEEFGGHKRAAGLRVRQEMVQELRSRINAFANDISVEDMAPVLDIDMELSLGKICMELIGGLSRLEPYGEANPPPVFVTRRVLVKSRPKVMGRDTVKFWVSDGRVTHQALGFGMAPLCAGLRMGQAVDIAYSLSIDDWNKAPQPQITLKDIKVLTK